MLLMQWTFFADNTDEAVVVVGVAFFGEIGAFFVVPLNLYLLFAGGFAVSFVASEAISLSDASKPLLSSKVFGL